MHLLMSKWLFMWEELILFLYHLYRKTKLVNGNTFVKIFPAINKHLSSFPEEYKYSQKYNALEWFNLTREIDSGIIHVTAS